MKAPTSLRSVAAIGLLSIPGWLAGFVPAPAADAAETRPNIILFVSDDHGIDALGCYGNPAIRTPHLDRLAAEGVRFTHAFCTSASCAASRSVILTGKFGHATGSYGHTHDYHHFRTYDTVLSLPVLLEAHGYETARIGKYHLAPESVYRFRQVLEADPRSAVEMAEQCEGVLHSDKPFFLYFCTDDPHRGAPFEPDPWDAPNSFGNRPEGYPGIAEIAYDPAEVIVPPFLPDNIECRRELAEYYRSVSRIDQGLGRLLKLLETAGKTGSTVVIYISDNGIAFPGAKTNLYEPGIRLPCIVKHPRIELRGAVNNAMIAWADLAPTILDMAGVDIRNMDFHGRSFLGILGQEHPVGWDEVYASHTFHEITMYYPMRVCRERRFKLIWNAAWQLPYPFASDLWVSPAWQRIHRDGGEFYGKRRVRDYLHRPEFELYDLEPDPGELRNLAESEAHAADLARLIEKLKAFQRKTRDPWLILWDKDASLQGSGVNL